jgi:hypothetical protein
MKKSLLVVLMAILLLLPAAAFAQGDDPFAGYYHVTGESYGTVYEAALAVVEAGTTYTVAWMYPDGSVILGVGTPLDEDSLAVAYYSSSDPGCAVQINDRASNGSMEGTWFESPTSYGSESLIPLQPSKALPGDYQASGTSADGSTYEGTFTIEKAGANVFGLTWELGEEASFRGVGVLVDGRLVISMRVVSDESVSPCGVEVISWNQDGSISGLFAWDGDTATGVEDIAAWSD